MIRLSMSTLVSWANIFKEPSTNSSEARASSWASRSGWRLISFLQSERMGWRALPPLLMKSWYTLAVQRSMMDLWPSPICCSQMLISSSDLRATGFSPMP